MCDKPLNILLIGPLPPPIGGTTVLFESLVAHVSQANGVQMDVINTSGIRGGLESLYKFAKLLSAINKKVRKTDVVCLNAATSGLWIIGPICYLAARLAGKKFLIRKFGGTDYRNYGFFKRKITGWVLRRCDLYLAETKMLVEAARQTGIKHVEWYPNNRPLAKEKTPMVGERKCCRRFVYLGHVRPVKGINEIIQAAERFDQDVSVDVYGPFFEGLSEETFKGLGRVRYCGVVPPETVVKTLEQYDALLLPTYHPGEGYPGVILEAYRAGLPVICTRWRALPEIVDETCGILIEPRSGDGLYEAMKKLTEDDEHFARLREGVKLQHKKFSAEVWNERFVEYCRNLISKRDSVES